MLTFDARFNHSRSLSAPHGLPTCAMRTGMVRRKASYLGYGRVQVFADLTHVHNTLDTVESRYYLYRCANWSSNCSSRNTITPDKAVYAKR